MLHHVTLGGSGTGKGVRHPVVGNGVLLGAGVRCAGQQAVFCHQTSALRHGTGGAVASLLTSPTVSAPRSVLGPVVIGHCSKIGAGSVVATDLPPHVVAGAPRPPARLPVAFFPRRMRARPSSCPPPPCFTTCPAPGPAPAAVGVPARVIKRLDEFEEPVKQMDQVGCCCCCCGCYGQA